MPRQHWTLELLQRAEGDASLEQVCAEEAAKPGNTSKVSRAIKHLQQAGFTCLSWPAIRALFLPTSFVVCEDTGAHLLAQLLTVYVVWRLVREAAYPHEPGEVHWTSQKRGVLTDDVFHDLLDIRNPVVECRKRVHRPASMRNAMRCLQLHNVYKEQDSIAAFSPRVAQVGT